MPVSSYIIRCPEERQPEVIQALKALAPDNLTVGYPTSAGIPVATDTRSTREASFLGDQLQNVPGVTSAILVYHNFEDLEDSSPEVPGSSPTHSSL